MTRSQKFHNLFQQAAQCTICPRMTDQTAVLSKSNGSIKSKILFIAEAPGRLGSGRTGVPFHGDKSGDNFEKLIAHVGLTRNDIFITNAVLCNPLSNGNNSKPTSGEVQNCSYFLKSIINLLQPKVIVTLGGVGLDALNRLLKTTFNLKENVGNPQNLDSFWLLPLYHPSPRVTNWKRKLPQQKKDFKKIIDLLMNV